MSARTFCAFFTSRAVQTTLAPAKAYCNAVFCQKSRIYPFAIVNWQFYCQFPNWLRLRLRFPDFATETFVGDVWRLWILTSRIWNMWNSSRKQVTLPKSCGQIAKKQGGQEISVYNGQYSKDDSLQWTSWFKSIFHKTYFGTKIPVTINTNHKVTDCFILLVNNTDTTVF